MSAPFEAIDGERPDGPVVLVFGWVGAQPRLLGKYAAACAASARRMYHRITRTHARHFCQPRGCGVPMSVFKHSAPNSKEKPSPTPRTHLRGLATTNLPATITQEHSHACWHHWCAMKEDKAPLQEQFPQVHVRAVGFRQGSFR
jgi:hypothetical protein